MSTSIRVLVIDDHAIVRAGICAALERREDFSIFQAASKSEAFAQMAKVNPDVIVVDINLPDGSGLKLTVARYYTPKDRSIQAKGIRPDVVVTDKNSVERENGGETRKESDLKGHIESADLSDIAANQGITKAIRNWPEAMQKDVQLTTGFTYLKSYSMFQRRSMNDRP